MKKENSRVLLTSALANGTSTAINGELTVEAFNKIDEKEIANTAKKREAYGKAVDAVFNAFIGWRAGCMTRSEKATEYLVKELNLKLTPEQLESTAAFFCFETVQDTDRALVVGYVLGRYGELAGEYLDSLVASCRYNEQVADTKMPERAEKIKAAREKMINETLKDCAANGMSEEAIKSLRKGFMQ